MKLYTEEQMEEAYNRGLMDGRLNNIDYSITDGFTPIELPTDEEIHPNSPYESNSDWDIGYHNGWRQGAKWMRDKIKGGNK